MKAGKLIPFIGISRESQPKGDGRESQKSENLARHLAEENKIIAEMAAYQFNTEIEESTSALLKWDKLLLFDRISVSLTTHWIRR